ncbi:SFRS4_5_6 [Mytilus coruscus]|uniref:SFRS4_5_6 n=1 Tax=Mytilus coruscus TaxID=42192 RepID=A0A6J8CT72_MYTCO|nr:SFRS4_5_6 [Mytilus coruscus]
MHPPMDSRPRRSPRLLRKKQVFHEPNLSANETDTEPQGDTAGLYGVIKGAEQDMTSQVVSAFQAAFRINFFHSLRDLHRLSETRAIHARSSNDKGSVRSARSRSKSYVQTDNTSSSEDSCPDSSNDESLGTSLLNRSKSKSKSDFPHNVKLPAYAGKEKWEAWYNRFEAVARLGKGDVKSKLRELLLHLKGATGDCWGYLHSLQTNWLT